MEERDGSSYFRARSLLAVDTLSRLQLWFYISLVCSVRGKVWAVRPLMSQSDTPAGRKHERSVFFSTCK